MAAYTNDLRLKEIATGDESGTWGDSTNTNLELIAEAFSFGTEAITTNADTHATTIADGATDEGRSIYLKYTGTLDSACTITLGPNTVSKLWFIENATSGSQNIIISQGSGANVTIPAGEVKAVYSDGAGSGAAIVDAFANLKVSDAAQTNITSLGTLTTLTVDDITINGSTISDAGNMDFDIGGDLTIDVDGADIKFADGGTEFADHFKDGSDYKIQTTISDGDFIIVGNDGGSAVNALTLDMSDAGSAYFNNKVGIGTTSPTGKLEIAATGTNAAPQIKLVEDSDTREFNIFNDGSGNGHLVLADSDDDTPDTEIVLNDNGIITMLTGNSERMRIDSSGNVLVGTTDSSLHEEGFRILPAGSSSATAVECFNDSGGTALFVGRGTSDGTMIDLRRGSSNVGSIGSEGGDALFIQSGSSSGAGLLFHPTSGFVAPVRNSVKADDTIDLGKSNSRFKDIYLSGSAFIGGTGSANGLDDYEEGTWTPTFVGATLTQAVGTYTKIGNLVTVSYRIVTTGGLPSSGTPVQIGGLPFNISSATINSVASGFGGVGSVYVAPSNVTSAVGGGGTIVSFASGGEAFLRYVVIDTTTFGYLLMGELEVTANNQITAVGTQTYQV